MEPVCGEMVIFYPDEECLDFTCVLPEGHKGRHQAEDEYWNWENDED